MGSLCLETSWKKKMADQSESLMLSCTNSSEVTRLLNRVITILNSPSGSATASSTTSSTRAVENFR